MMDDSISRQAAIDADEAVENFWAESVYILNQMPTIIEAEE